MQIRRDPSFNFNRNYAEYVAGFGDPLSDYWMSLTELHDLTNEQPAILYLRLEDRVGDASWAIYDSFEIADASSNFRMTISGYQGTAGDCLILANGIDFSAPDADNDPHGISNCAADRESGFWFGDTGNTCGGASPNGRLDVAQNNKIAAHWYYHKNSFEGLKYFEMYIHVRN